MAERESESIAFSLGKGAVSGRSKLAAMLPVFPKKYRNSFPKYQGACGGKMADAVKGQLADRC